MLLGNRKGPTVSYRVRSKAGQKSFDKLEGNNPTIHARAFAASERLKEGGWASIERLTTETIERRS